MELEKAIDKIRKLLKLAERAGTPEEAAAAAAAAARLQEEYRIETLELEDAGGASEGVSEGNIEAGLYFKTWATYLSSVLARTNDCRTYITKRYKGDGKWACYVVVVGRKSDREAVADLYAYLSVQIDRLAARECRGKGATYANNFRLGCVDTASRKLSEEKKARDAARKATPQGQHAIVLLQKNALAVEDYMKRLKLRAGSNSAARSDHGARNHGRAAGESLSTGRRTGLASARALPPGKG